MARMTKTTESGDNAGIGSLSHLPPPQRSPSRTLKLAVLASFVLIVATVVGVKVLQPQQPRHKVFVSGRIDGYETYIAAKIAGLVKRISSREGDSVKTGQVLVELEASDARAQLKQAVAGAQRARAAAEGLREAQTNINRQIEEAKSAQEQAQEEWSGRLTQVQFNIQSLKEDADAAQADIRSTQTKWTLADLTARRYAALVTDGALPQEKADQALAEADALKNEVESKKQRLKSIQQQIAAAQGTLQSAQALRLIPEQRAKRILQLLSQLRQAKFQEQAADAAVQESLAKQEELKATLNYLTVTSPIDGVVIARSAEPGAVVASGQTVLTLLDPSTVFLRGFVPDSQIGLVRIGQRASVILDSSPHSPITGHVSEVDPQASFTPENIYFKKDRVKQVFGVKISLDDPAGYAKLGMPADADIFLDEPSP